MVPHLNALHETYAARGLSVIGVTDGEPEETAPWVQQLGMKYGWGHDPSLNWVFEYNVWTYPHTLVVDASGTVVWSGPPQELDERTVRTHLKEVVKPPLWTWPEAAKTVKRRLLDHRYVEAMEAADALAAEDPVHAPIRKAVDQHLALRVKAAERAHEAGDFATAVAIAQELALDLGTREPGPRMASWVEMIRSDETRVSIIDTQLELRRLKLLYVETLEKADQLTEHVEWLIERHPGTAVEREGRMAMGMWEWLRPGLPPASAVPPDDDGGGGSPPR